MANIPPSRVWCTLVMLNDNYACGAATVAQSLRDVGSIYPAWCMVTTDVSPEAVQFLKTMFDNVVVVPTIAHKVVPMKSAKQRQIYGGWIHASFTKWQILSQEYFPNIDRVCFLDADMVFLENCDELMDMPCPAATFATPWSYPYIDKINTKHNNLGGYNPYYNTRTERGLAHGELVSHSAIKKGLASGIVGCGCMVLAQPEAALYKLFKSILDATHTYGNSACMSGFDEQIFAEIMLRSRTPIYHIHPKYNAFIGKVAWLEGEKPKTIQYYNTKPWHGIKTQEDVAASPWEDVRVWWSIAQKIIDRGVTDGTTYTRYFYQC